MLVEVRKHQEKLALSEAEGSSCTMVEDLWNKVNAYRCHEPSQVVVPAFLSLGGFTTEAQAFYTQHGIGTVEQIPYYWDEMS